jgi:hypothetical protein
MISCFIYILIDKFSFQSLKNSTLQYFIAISFFANTLGMFFLNFDLNSL